MGGEKNSHVVVDTPFCVFQLAGGAAALLVAQHQRVPPAASLWGLTAARPSRLSLCEARRTQIEVTSPAAVHRSAFRNLSAAAVAFKLTVFSLECC
jgi:hypothetical protein